jgi:hypothetical protein
MGTQFPRFFFLLLCVVTSWCQQLVLARAEENLWLVRDGNACATIVFGRGDDFAAERLQRFLTEQSGATVETIPAERWQAFPKNTIDKDCVVLVGSEQSNPVLKKLGGQFGLKLDPAGLTEQGYVAKRISHEGRDWLILAGGGRDGSQYAVVDLFQGKLQHAGQNVWLASLDAREIPRFRYRWFWNWDNRMDWGGPGELGSVMAHGDGPNKNTKKPEAFLIDGKHCIDYMADHKWNGLILWGFLRDSHGGIEASRELCRYAAHRGVRILPGVGTSGYTGYYYEGDNEFNGDTWLAMHPELRAIGKDGKPHQVPCPSKKENQKWLDRGAEWLFGNFEIGGVNLEMGDFFVCYCDDCKQARAAIESSEPDYYKDMAISHSVTLATMRKLAPEAWLSYATYTGYTAEMVQTPPKFLSMIPDDAVCQWTLSKMVKKPWDASIRPLAKHNIGYLHWCNVPSGTAHDFYLSEVQMVCRQAAAAGFEGLDTYGELSNEQPNVEISYLAWETFLWNPEMTLEEFADQRLAPLYGGKEPARALLEIIPLVRTAKERANMENLVRATALADSARKSAAPEGISHWDRLLNYLAERRADAKKARDLNDKK